MKSLSRFPDPRESDAEGLVGIGGELDPEWLLDAYRHGIFPWPSSDQEPIAWWSPDPRATMPLDGFQTSKRLARRIRSGRFCLTCDQAFGQVLTNCASGKGREEGTWLTANMREAYHRMYELGHAHSVEVWLNPTESDETPQLVGGVYGLAIGGLFAAESMFHRVTDGSKIALSALVVHLNARGYSLLDIQQWTDHTGSLGAVEISRDEYLDRLVPLVDLSITFGDCLEGQ